MKLIDCLLALLFAVVLSSSCQKIVDPELGAFQDMDFLIDMSQHNQYNADMFCKSWVRSKVTYEVYVDGIRTDSSDVTHEWGNTGFTLRSDGTMTLGKENGQWLYSHNYLLWSTGCWAQEVVKIDIDTLYLRWEQLLSASPFFVDNSGEHHFYIFEYRDSKFNQH